jgi:hypothetical protein
VCVCLCVCVCVCVCVYIYLKQELKSRGLAECSAILSKKYKSRAAVEWLTAEARFYVLVTRFIVLGDSMKYMQLFEL